MLTGKLFKNASVKCADDYIMLSTYESNCEEIIEIIKEYGVDEIIISPAKNIMRITLRNMIRNSDTNVVTVNEPTYEFLNSLCDLNVKQLNIAIETYWIKSDKMNDKMEIWENGKWTKNEELAIDDILCRRTYN